MPRGIYKRTALHNRKLNRTRCPQGHDYTSENTYVNAKGYNLCKTCMRARRQHGWTPALHDAISKAQNGLCAICKRHMPNTNHDHDHITGKPRGLLCSQCNSALGLLQDSPELVDVAAAYLRKYKDQPDENV
jgi:hypothetical protein